MTVSLDAAQSFILRNARLLDRRRLQLLLDVGGPEDVVTALRAYRNPDGGFGNALEPDIRGWSSQPVGAQIALEVLREAGGRDDALTRDLLDWCAGTAIGDALPFVLPSVGQAPAAPWWVPDGRPSLNPTAAIVGIARGLGLAHPWLERAAAWCWQALEEQLADLDAHAALCAVVLVDEAAAPAGLTERLGERVLDGLAALDPAASGYVLSPLLFAPTPDSAARSWFPDAVIDAHLVALAQQQQDDGGWPITWEPPAGAARAEWRGARTVAAMRTLRAYHRLPG